VLQRKGVGLNNQLIGSKSIENNVMGEI